MVLSVLQVLWGFFAEHHPNICIYFLVNKLLCYVIFEIFTGPGFNSTSPDTYKKFLSDVFTLCILHLQVPTTLSLTPFDLNNLCFLVLARFVLLYTSARCTSFGPYFNNGNQNPFYIELLKTDNHHSAFLQLVLCMKLL